MAATVQVFSTESALILDLGEASAGYQSATLPDLARVWEQDWSTVPYADGGSLNTERLGIVTKQITTRIRGASWVEVEQRYEALVAAIEVGAGFLVIGRGGVDRTWRIAGRASSSVPTTVGDELNLTTAVTWTIPVQPTGTVTFPEEP